MSYMNIQSPNRKCLQPSPKDKTGEITVTKGKLAQRRYTASVPSEHVQCAGTCRKTLMMEVRGAGCKMCITQCPAIESPVQESPERNSLPGYATSFLWGILSKTCFHAYFNFKTH